MGMGEHVAALEAFDRAIKLDPVSAPLMTESGWPLSFVGLHTEARKRYFRALELEPDLGLAQYNVALTYEDENTSETIEWYERAAASSGGAPYWSRGTPSTVGLYQRAHQCTCKGPNRAASNANGESDAPDPYRWNTQTMSPFASTSMIGP
jgi:tetratricopeptide (TPR) repeat protein